MGLTCDIFYKSFYKSIVVAPTNTSCSTTTSTSPLSDGLTYDVSLMVKNETLKKEVNELTHALGNAYGGDACLLKCLGSCRCFGPVGPQPTSKFVLRVSNPGW